MNEQNFNEFVKFWSEQDSPIHVLIKSQDEFIDSPCVTITIHTSDDSLFMEVSHAKKEYKRTSGREESGKRYVADTFSGYSVATDYFQTSSWMMREAPHKIQDLHERMINENLPRYKKSSMAWIIENFNLLDWKEGKPPSNYWEWIRKGRRISIADKRFMRRNSSLSIEQLAERMDRYPHIIEEYLSRQH